VSASAAVSAIILLTDGLFGSLVAVALIIAVVHVGADVLAFFFDETGKLLELGFLFCHMQGSIPYRWIEAGGAGFGDADKTARRRNCKRERDFSGVGFAKRWGSRPARLRRERRF
jgi:hypothetical protein